MHSWPSHSVHTPLWCSPNLLPLHHLTVPAYAIRQRRSVLARVSIDDVLVTPVQPLSFCLLLVQRTNRDGRRRSDVPLGATAANSLHHTGGAAGGGSHLLLTLLLLLPDACLPVHTDVCCHISSLAALLCRCSPAGICWDWLSVLLLRRQHVQ